ncbi:MAG TPA: DUF4382 domain-containing protein [Terriglobales bacterium]|nr:DUF4382 domain-containing protein [Terriglobales bacterium]
MKRGIPATFLFVLIALLLTACGGGTSSSTSNGSQQSGSVFVAGEDTPLPAVLAFNVTINSITLSNSSTSVQALSQPTTVDFARLLGLRTLLGFNSVPAGTYTSATITLANPLISYLNLSSNPASVGTITGTLTTNTVTIALAQPMVVNANGLAGLHLDFDLRQSIQLDGAGQITGVVNPTLDLKPVAATDEDGQITDLRGGLVSINTSNNTFVLQRVGGHDITIDVNNATKYSGTYTLASLPNPSVIEVDGQVQNDGSVLASEVEVVTTSQAFISGRIVDVNPSTGPASTVTLLVGEELPALQGINVGFPVTIDVSGVTDYDIRHFDNWFTQFLFNNSSMVTGQRIAIGGTLDTTTNPPTFVPQRIVLRRQGVVGDLVPGSVNIISGNLGNFQLQNNSLFGYILGAPLTVNTGNSTRFINISGLAAMQSGGSMKLVVHGLILKNQNTGNGDMWAHRVRVLP